VLARDGESLRYAVHREGLLGRARTLDSSTFREWERYLAGPSSPRGRSTSRRATPAAGRSSTASWCAPAASCCRRRPILLWRQRLGVAAVIGELDATADFAG
jgi:hypothetical protein